MRSGRFWAYFKVELREFPIEEDVAVLERTKLRILALKAPKRMELPLTRTGGGFGWNSLRGKIRSSAGDMVTLPWLLTTKYPPVQASGGAGNVNVGVISMSGYPKPPEGQDSQGCLTLKWRQLS